MITRNTITRISQTATMLIFILNCFIGGSTRSLVITGICYIACTVMAESAAILKRIDERGAKDGNN